MMFYMLLYYCTLFCIDVFSTLTNVEILHLSTSVYKYFSASKLALSLRYVLNLFLPLILSLF